MCTIDLYLIMSEFIPVKRIPLEDGSELYLINNEYEHFHREVVDEMTLVCILGTKYHWGY